MALNKGFVEFALDQLVREFAINLIKHNAKHNTNNTPKQKREK